ncbi:uncharacterized protein KY384_005109 [Bacidia gigantensis]|uniref:uncharacterized protein n=1 Tax=Bacidia gigantensis TaxID=2732470 RepID=UPI001D051F5F|nr:uncharacterized protein KY384_005109 [Bacidia gigantensis]KAG8529629.1 hypothetical protein KY384_005109 [Bacidia gigantensis]
MEKPYPPPAEGNVNLGPAMLATTAVIVGLTTIVVALRLAVRIWITKIFWWDDWTILFAILGNIIGAGLDFVEIHYGFGRPQYYLTEWQLIEFKKYTYGEWIQTFFTLMWTKVSICLFLLRIPVTKRLIRPLQASVVFLLVSNVVLTIIWIAQCKPVDRAWNEHKKGSCLSKGELQRVIMAQANGGTTNWFWRTFEVQIGIIAACTPALRPGYKWLRHKITGEKFSQEDTRLTEQVHLQPVRTPKPLYKSKHISSDDESTNPSDAPYASV